MRIPSLFYACRADSPSRRHVKALESRSQLLDAALASADEANRRWEDCRALVDQLRAENAQLRAALDQAGLSNGQGQPLSMPPPRMEMPPQDDALREGGNAGGTKNPPETSASNANAS